MFMVGCLSDLCHFLAFLWQLAELFCSELTLACSGLPLRPYPRGGSSVGFHSYVRFLTPKKFKLGIGQTEASWPRANLFQGHYLL